MRVAKDDENIVFRNGCDDDLPNMPGTLRYKYENGQIKNNKSGLCLKNFGNKNHVEDKIKLTTCNKGSYFDLI